MVEDECALLVCVVTHDLMHDAARRSISSRAIGEMLKRGAKEGTLGALFPQKARNGRQKKANT
jgi:hypothetical protein